MQEGIGPSNQERERCIPQTVGEGGMGRPKNREALRCRWEERVLQTNEASFFQDPEDCLRDEQERKGEEDRGKEEGWDGQKSQAVKEKIIPIYYL